MINVRLNVFETNSSSSHSITISPSTDCPDTIHVREHGTIILRGGEFGWEWETYSDALEKANYCAVDCKDDPEKQKMLINVIKKHTKAKRVIIDLAPGSYIDHQSSGTSFDAFEDEETLRQFLFNYGSCIETGNDNE